jgi:hypothetical protein
MRPSPCGSGGRQVMEKMYEGADAFHKMKGPAPYTFGRNEFPSYCAHCYYQNLFPLFPGAGTETVPSEKPGEAPCSCYIYMK